jgi:hypothetical protein
MKFGKAKIVVEVCLRKDKYTLKPKNNFKNFLKTDLSILHFPLI